eukprot:1114054-Rhodomonas_salina.1
MDPTLLYLRARPPSGPPSTETELFLLPLPSTEIELFLLPPRTSSCELLRLLQPPSLPPLPPSPSLRSLLLLEWSASPYELLSVDRLLPPLSHTPCPPSTAPAPAIDGGVPPSAEKPAPLRMAVSRCACGLPNGSGVEGETGNDEENKGCANPVSYTHLRAHETEADL